VSRVTTCDLAVIGAGPGGYVAAIRAAQLGMRVACVEKEPALGGTCLRIGCIPSKALLDSTELYHKARHELGAHGIVGEFQLDLPAMLRRKEKVVDGLARGVAALFKKHRIVRLTGTARIAAPGELAVDGPDRGTVRAGRILIATGSEPIALPGLPFDGAHVVTSAEALALPRVPARMLVVGAGAIGLELGSVWARLGARVHVVELLDRIVPGMDGELARALERLLARQGLGFDLSAKVTDARVVDDQVSVTVETGAGVRTERVDVMLVAVGRRPYTSGLGLDDLGIALDGRGRIPVDERFQTAVPGIHAIGDAIRGPMLAHKAEEEGIACVELMAGRAGHVNYEAIPNVVYTWPELAGVGRTEEQCREQGIDARIGRFPFLASGRARAMDERDGLAKVIADARTDRVLGVHILGPRASDLIAEAALAIEFGASAEDIARTCHAHPSLPEAVREAALGVDGRSIHQ
jgi:dihydrolipoamide dehydrogenase